MLALPTKKLPDPAAEAASGQVIHEVSPQALAAALNAAVSRQLPGLLSLLSALALSLVAYHYFVRDDGLVFPLTLAALVGAGILILLRLVKGYVSLPHRLSQPLAALGLALLAQYGLLRLGFLGDPGQTVYLLPIILASGFIFLSWVWSTLLVVCIIAGWLYCAIGAGLSESWWNAGIQLAATGVVSLVVHGARWTGARHLESLRLQESDLLHRTSQAIQAATESHERLERLCCATFEGILIHDDGVIVQANEVAPRLFGLESSDIRGKSVLDLMSPESRKCISERVLMGNFQSFEGVGLRSDTSTFPVELLAKSLPWEGRKLKVLALRDITERKKAEQLLAQERKLLELQNRRQAALAQLELAIGETSELNSILNRIAEITAQILPASGGAAVLTWRGNQQVSLNSFGNLAAMGSPKQFQEQLQQAKATRWILDNRESLFVADTGQKSSRDLPLFCGCGVAAFAGLPLISEGEVLGILFAFETEPRTYKTEDHGFLHSLASRAAAATRKVRLYEELRRTNTELQSQKEQLQRRNQELAAATQAAQAANRAKTEFLATMSHELRTPLNGILGMTEVLLFSELTSEQHENLQSVRTSGEHLLALIDKVLNYARLESSEINLQKADFDPRRLAQESLSTIANKAEAKGLKTMLEISTDLPDAVHGDPNSLRDTLTFLLDNAVKLTNQGQVSIRGFLKEKSAAGFLLQFEVRDTGIGIAREAIPLLFKPFAQTDGSHSRAHGGTGLGLALCQKMVNLMGGEIGVHSLPGVGSAFWFTVPVERPSALLSV